VVKQLSKSPNHDTGRAALAIAAASRGRELIVSLLLDHHASVDIRDGDGYYPIHYAASAGNMIAIGFIHGASIKVKTKAGETALYLACANAYFDAARVLLNCGAGVNVFDDGNYTLLKGAARSGSTKVVELLIKHGAEVDKVHGNGCICTPLIIAAHEGHVDVMQILLDNHAAIDRPGDRHGTALYRACQGGHEGAVGLLLSRKANLEARGDDDEWTPLITATGWGMTES
jgi:ankyrin repeat protein